MGFSRTYCPSALPEVVKLWKADLAQVNTAVAESLANPAEYPDLFPDYGLTVQAEGAFQQHSNDTPKAQNGFHGHRHCYRCHVAVSMLSSSLKKGGEQDPQS